MSPEMITMHGFYGASVEMKSSAYIRQRVFIGSTEYRRLVRFNESYIVVYTPSALRDSILGQEAGKPYIIGDFHKISLGYDLFEV